MAALAKRVEELERDEARYRQALFDIIKETSDKATKLMAINAIYPGVSEQIKADSEVKP